MPFNKKIKVWMRTHIVSNGMDRLKILRPFDQAAIIVKIDCPEKHLLTVAL